MKNLRENRSSARSPCFFPSPNLQGLFRVPCEASFGTILVLGSLTLEIVNEIHRVEFDGNFLKDKTETKRKIERKYRIKRRIFERKEVICLFRFQTFMLIK